MSFERPWEKAFDQLRRALEKAYEMVDKPHTDAERVQDQSGGVNIWQYPQFAATRKGMLVTVTIGEFPIGVVDAIGGSDNVEFLQLSVFRPLGLTITIRHEGFADRFFKAVKIEWEFQTGNPEFDRKYYITCLCGESPHGIQGRFQRQIEKLEPFASVVLSDRGVHWSQSIEDGSQLTFPYVDDHLGQLTDLATLAAELTQS